MIAAAGTKRPVMRQSRHEPHCPAGSERYSSSPPRCMQRGATGQSLTDGGAITDALPVTDDVPVAHFCPVTDAGGNVLASHGSEQLGPQDTAGRRDDCAWRS